MGRFNFLQALNLTDEDLLDLHKTCQHIDQLAEDLEVSKRTLLKHLKRLLNPSEIKYKPRKDYKKHSKFAQWRRNNPDIILPNSVPELEKLTKLSRFTIHHYLYRRLEDYHIYVKQNFSTFLKKHRKKSLLKFQNIQFPIKALQRTGLTIDKFSLTMLITFQLKNQIIKRVYITEEYFRKTIQEDE